MLPIQRLGARGPRGDLDGTREPGKQDSSKYMWQTKRLQGDMPPLKYMREVEKYKRPKPDRSIGVQFTVLLLIVIEDAIKDVNAILKGVDEPTFSIRL